MLVAALACVGATAALLSLDRGSATP
jgi:hypothetical protein